MAAPILYLRDIHLTFGGTPILEGAELSLSEGDRLCVVGRNGSGKSTLLKVAAGQIEADGGERFVQPGMTVRYLPQEPDFGKHPTTLAYVESGLGPGDDPYRAQYLLEQLGLTGAENPDRLSGGEARRTALARVLAPDPDILLLDEPTNHLDLPAIEWLESELATMRAAMILISHDRRFLENLSRATIWIDRGETRRLERNFAHFEEWRDEVLAQEELDRHKLDRKLAMEADWLRYGVTARRKRNMGRLRALQNLRRQKREQRAVQGAVKLGAAEGIASGKIVAEAKGLDKAYGGTPVVSDLSIRIQRGDRIGIVGPNGAGKTTILNMLTGALEPDTGEIRLGANLLPVTLDQRRESLNPEWTLRRALSVGGGDTVSVGGVSRHVVGYMKDFLFTPQQAGTPIGVLSGGERGRLMLARALAKPSNLLVLDEPTNDLDLETLDLLQEMLADYAGTVLLVSHDRDFLDRVVTSVLASEGDGAWVEYAGGYTDMVAQRGHGIEGAPVVRETARPKAAKPKPKSQPEPRKGLTFKQQHALKALPGRIEALQAKIETLSAVLGDADLFARDPARFEKTAAELTAAQSELAACEDEWLELETLREEAESA